MLGKLLVIITFIFILFNLFAGLRYLFGTNHDSDKLLRKLKWRIGISVSLFIMIIIGFLTGFIEMHTL